MRLRLHPPARPRNLERLFPVSRGDNSLGPKSDMSKLLPRARSNIAGLDGVLGGGWARNRLHLLEGSPGTGKTTIALQFLLAGAADGEAGIYVSLAETEQELREGAKSHGWSIGPLV